MEYVRVKRSLCYKFNHKVYSNIIKFVAIFNFSTSSNNLVKSLPNILGETICEYLSIYNNSLISGLLLAQLKHIIGCLTQKYWKCFSFSKIKREKTLPIILIPMCGSRRPYLGSELIILSCVRTSLMMKANTICLYLNISIYG